MTLSSRDRILLVVVVAVVAVFGFYHFALSPERHRAQALQTQVATQRTSLVRAQEQYAAARSASRSLRTSAPTYVASRRAVPRVSDIPGLLRLLERAAHEAHVSMDSISLSSSATDTTDPTVAGASGASPTGADGTTEIPVTLTFGGGYQALRRLVDRLDTLVTVSGRHIRASGPLVGISAISLSGAAGGLSVNLTAVVYQHAAAGTVLATTTAGTS